ncbi:MAG: mechanosensitive ion channel family protein [Candidatus Marinimicrobia bacterium]|nr:mechanosensitive ion channel family protein [Candidatus Neomarinimicrobiota bacterium]
MEQYINLLQGTPLYDWLKWKPVQAIILILFSIILSKLFDWIVTSVLTRLTKKTKTSFDDKLISILHRPIFYTILFFGFNISINLLDFSEKFHFTFSGIFKTITIFIWSAVGFSSLLEILSWYAKSDKTNRLIRKRTLPLFDNLGKIIIFIVASYFIMVSWKIDVTGWLASAGVLGIVLGLAAKDTLANLFAGIFIMADAPYKEADYINLDTGERGYIRSIGLRSTRIMTRDDIEITVPNSIIANSKIVNESGGPHEHERIRVKVNVAYGSDVEQVKNILIEIAVKTNSVRNSPIPLVRFREFQDSSLYFQLLCWIEEPAFRGRVIDEINTEIYNRFNKEGIKFPFPQRTLHIANWNAENKKG